MHPNLSQKIYSFCETFSYSFFLFKKLWKIIVPAFLLINIPNIANIALNLKYEDWLHSVPLSFCVFLVSGLILLFTTNFCFYTVKSSLQEEKIVVSSLLQRSGAKLFYTFWTNGVMIVFLFFLTLLFIIPGIIFLILWSFSAYVTLNTDFFGKEALNYSKRIVKGNWGKTFAYFCLLIVLNAFLFYILRQHLSSNWLIHLFLILLTVLISAFFNVVFSLVFFNFDAVYKEKNTITEIVPRKTKKQYFGETVLVLLYLTHMWFTVSIGINTRVYTPLVEKYMAEGKYELAIESYNKIKLRNKFNPSFYSGRGYAYLALKDYSNALEDFNFGITFAYDKNIRSILLTNRGVTYLNLNKLEEAEKDFNESIALNPKEGNVYLHRGTLFLQKENYEKACEDFYYAQTIVPEAAEVYIAEYCQKS